MRKAPIDRSIQRKLIPFESENYCVAVLPNGGLFDFRSWADTHGDIANALAQSFMGMRAHCRLPDGNFDKIKIFFEFLRQEPEMTLSGFDTSAVRRFVHFLNTRVNRTALSVTSKAAIYGEIRTLFRWLKLHKRHLLNSDCEFRSNPWPGVRLARKETEPLEPSDVAKIEAACLKEITRVVNQYGHDVEGTAVQGPTSDDILPFVVFIASRTYANSEAIRALRTDCTSPHPLHEHCVSVTWAKGRANRAQTRSFFAQGPNSIPRIIEQARAVTARLRRVAPEFQDLLFIFAAHNHGFKIANFLATSTWAQALERFTSSHQLPSFQLKQLRASGANMAYQATGGDVRKVASLLNHESPQTTSDHYLAAPARLYDQEIIASAQVRLFRWIRTGKTGLLADLLAEFPSLPVEDLENIARGNWRSTSGFRCLNPFKSPRPGQMHGQLCTDWLGCLSCPQSILFQDPETLARLLQLRDHIKAARSTLHPNRFLAHYQTKLHVIEAVHLTRFKDTTIWSEANQLLSTLTPLPPLE